ncbi:Argonaute siRNA chaperone complex subunit Arb1-domain-containing protein [Kalaharituber pfeilii]|nr:Argonaute siRNA chaperone complex subunit Arb1-domain-containing protein [Kalaharituber pfeilii]
MSFNPDDNSSDTESAQGQPNTEPVGPNYVSMKQQLDMEAAEAVGRGECGEEPAKKKKKKKRKPKKNVRNTVNIGSLEVLCKFNTKPTGFEAYFVETPISPAQAEELGKLYSTTIPFAERIEKCIQRYRAKRRWDPLRLQLFNSYLVLGGIRAGQKSFGGGIMIEGRGEDGEDADAADIAQQTATDFVDLVPISQRNANDWTGTPDVFGDEDEEWWVDFEYVVKAFLSHKVPFVFCLHTEGDIVVAVNTIKNFLNYIVFHNVAPEYSQNITKALNICNLAEKELLFCLKLHEKMPGKFNMACSALFGGYYYGLYESNEEVAWEGKKLGSSLGIPVAEARKVYDSAIINIGMKGQGNMPVVVQTDSIEFEVLEIYKPEGDLTALGYVDAHIWCYEGERLPNTNIRELTLYFEKDILMYMFEGLKLEANVHTLSNGLRYIDNMTAAKSSFYTYLEPPVHGDIKDAASAEGEELDA